MGHAVTPCPSHALGSLPGPCYGLVGLVAPLSVYLARALCATESPETCALHLHAFALVTASPPPPFLTCSEKRHRASWAKSVCALGKTWVLRRLWCEGSSSIMTPQSMTMTYDTTNLPSSSSAESSTDSQKDPTPRCYLLSAVDNLVDGIARQLLPCAARWVWFLLGSRWCRRLSSELSLAGVAPGPAAAANVKSYVSVMCCHFSGGMGAWALVF